MTPAETATVSRASASTTDTAPRELKTLPDTTATTRAEMAMASKAYPSTTATALREPRTQPDMAATTPEDFPQVPASAPLRVPVSVESVDTVSENIDLFLLT